MKYLVLNQLGTPKSPEPDDVGRYLTEFLMDYNVISLRRPLKDILVRIGIVPRRKFSSSEKYKKIWTEKGSPLAVNTYDLKDKLQIKLGSGWKVLVAMRYGEPSIASVLTQISNEMQTENFEELNFLPLYPQFAQATVGSALEKFEQEIVKLQNLKEKYQRTQSIKILAPFYNQDWYVKALGESIKPFLKDNPKLLLSYHGIPISQEKRSKISYYQQCIVTSRLLKNYLNIADDKITTSFQSRVGFAKWLGPSTTESAAKIAESGVETLKVACPSFVADCLETTEEIGLELKETFLDAGGKKFELIPCLNDNDLFVDGIISYLK